MRAHSSCGLCVAAIAGGTSRSGPGAALAAAAVGPGAPLRLLAFPFAAAPHAGALAGRARWLLPPIDPPIERRWFGRRTELSSLLLADFLADLLVFLDAPTAAGQEEADGEQCVATPFDWTRRA